MTRSRTLAIYATIFSTLLVCSLPPLAAQCPPSPILQHAIAFGSGHVTFGEAPLPYGFHIEAERHRHTQRPNGVIVVDPVLQRTNTPSSPEFNGGLNFLGVGTGFPNYTDSGFPPDTTLAVGTTEVVQWVNFSYADFNKSTGAIIPLNGQDSTIGNTIWSELIPGSLCAQNNSGDIIVKFDRDAQRWVMAQNVWTSPYAVCVAVSQTSTFSDNLWYAYEFPVVNNGLPDYPKWGVWSSHGASDGYFQVWNAAGGKMCGYDRAKLLAGDSTAEQICFELAAGDEYLLPADRDSPTLPPTTEDEFFIGTEALSGNSQLPVYSMHINNWTTGNASMTGCGQSQTVSIAPFNFGCQGIGICIPQEGVTTELSVEESLMYRLAYWEDASGTGQPALQHWLTNLSVALQPGDGQVGVRWMEFTASPNAVPVTSLAVHQQATYAGNPQDNNYRWMGSIARDNVGDILLGYSLSSSSMYPQIAVAGRVPTDPLNSLSPEVTAVNGPRGSQQDTGGGRWGDYSTISLDPSDNCTFFYTTEYYMTTSTLNWSTNISSWKFPNCH